MSTSSKWRLVVEAKLLGWSFRPRAWADCLEDIPRGLVQHRQRGGPGKLWVQQRNKRLFLQEGANAVLWFHANRTRDHAQVDLQEGGVSCALWPQRQRGRRDARGRRQGATQRWQLHRSKLWVAAGHYTSFWEPEQLGSAKGPTTWDQLPWWSTCPAPSDYGDQSIALTLQRPLLNPFLSWAQLEQVSPSKQLHLPLIPEWWPNMGDLKVKAQNQSRIPAATWAKEARGNVPEVIVVAV